MFYLSNIEKIESWVKVGFRPLIPPRTISKLNMVTLINYFVLEMPTWRHSKSSLAE